MKTDRQTARHDSAAPRWRRTLTALYEAVLIAWIVWILQAFYRDMGFVDLIGQVLTGRTTW